RPRKRGARWTGEEIRADEKVVDVRLAYEAKRDRWNGYDAERHRGIIREWEDVEEARRRRKALELDEKRKHRAQQGDASKGAQGDGGIEDVLASSDEESVEDSGDARPKAAVRNLRIREDTAKYLRNLDPDSAYYDPKTRSMRENPYATPTAASAGTAGAAVNPRADAYAGDNFVRFSGGAQEVAQKQVFAWEAEARGNSSAHFQANPTQSAMMYSEFRGKKERLAEEKRARVLEAYGGEEHLKAPPRELRVLQESYVEYSRAGQLLSHGSKSSDGGAVDEGKAGAAAAVRSRYREDVYPMNHSTVYGSWWSDGQWGYACCHQLPRNAYCTASVTGQKID
ncbi:mRNA splicing protein, partial [Coemansia sp. RSA 2607]